MRASLAVALSFLLLGSLTACDGSEEAEIGSTTQALFTEVPDFDGLSGFYKRIPSLFAPQGEITGVWLKGKDMPGGLSEGTYQSTVQKVCFLPGCRVEEGGYRAMPNNPVMGVAFISFTSAETRKTDYYIVDGILRNLWGQIVTMQMRHSKEQGLGLPFIVQRVF
jgi:hypothetical protein